ncbi:flagellar basal body rod protein FlgB [Paraferrimonas sp. SM1919]|uniref:flagellar basal body rod protein FlgB n=1 Tax=Paraferrimonas sp. SM1919 TaxID=2662263 RepID=UPI0013D87A73|nr:flagellar basal body rod protein FlgB [Paraferrimonas sp. SM1919]
MAINFKNALGIHQHALGLRAERAEVLATNITNADTPKYKAKDIDFAKELASAAKLKGKVHMNNTHENHFEFGGHVQGQLKYRIPTHMDTGDGNSVDMEQERNAFYKNAVEYQSSFTFLNGKFSGLRKAIKGS